MAKSSTGPEPMDRALDGVSSSTPPPAQRDGSCDRYDPGHQIHYKHQGDAVRFPAQEVREALVEDTDVFLRLENGEELHWRHHDPVRLQRMLELVQGRCLAYSTYHALRVGPYWFNCAAEGDEFEDCRVVDVEVSDAGPEGRTDS